MDYFRNKSYKLIYTCTIEVDEPEDIIDLICYQVSNGFDCECDYEDGELKITKIAHGNYCEGNPPEYDDDLCFDVDDVIFYLKTHKINYGCKWENYDYDFSY